MYHSRFKGTHHEAGLHYGALLYGHGAKLKEKHIFGLTPEKRDFGRRCTEICRNVYPEILDEMQGIAEGQKMPFEDLAAFLFGIYCFTPDNLCTCFAFKDANCLIFGRNSDFITKLEKFYESCCYRLDGFYSFIGNTTAMVQMEDGVNERGLAAGLTFIYPSRIRPGLNAGLLVRYILEKCGTVGEALAALHKLPLASNQTLTLLDRSGDMAVVECNSQKVVEIRPWSDRPFVATANNFNSEPMRQYRNPGIDDWRSDERYRVAKTALENADRWSLEFAKDLLSGRHGFMCQYDRNNGYDTVWSSIYDLGQNKIYRAEGNPARKKFIEDTRLKFRD